MKRILRWVDVAFKKNTKEDWDTAYIIAGDEGVGKSHLGMHLTEYWDKKLNGSIREDLIKFIALDRRDFVTALKDVDQYNVLTYDEAGELSNLRQMDKFNHMVTQAYRVIRGENLFTLLILPSVFDLNPFFTTRRARGLIQVYKRGQFAFYDKKRLRRIIEINRYRKVKTPNVISPTFRDWFPIYKGELMGSYEEKKRRKMRATRQKLYDELVDPGMKKEAKLILKAEQMIGKQKAAELFGVSTRTIYRRIKEAQALTKDTI